MELHRIIEDMRKDVSVNIDGLIQSVVEMRPTPDTPNYEQNSRLFDLILDETTKIMEDLERTFREVLGEFNENMEQLWHAISNDREDELKLAQENFRSGLEKYRTQWNQAFKHANEKVHDFEEQLKQK